MPEVLSSPHAGVPPLVDTVDELHTVANALATGTGPIAVDTERASGFRYDERAFLIQLKRAGAGLFLIDPVPMRDSIATVLGPVMNDAEWIIHAAATDLPCLYNVGLSPRELFDTEIAGRLAGLQRVNLAAMVEHYLDLTLLKGYGAADWSTRPLPSDWLTYAALDVDKLIELKEAVSADLESSDKLDWAVQEAEFIRNTFAEGDPYPAKTWRDTKRISKLRKAPQLAVLRALWNHRDQIARDKDIAVSRVVPDRVLVDIATALPRSRAHLLSVCKKAGAYIKQPDQWVRVINSALNGSAKKFPKPTPRTEDYVPARKDWAHLLPEASIALEDISHNLDDLVAEINIPLENIIRPASLREIVWNHFSTQQLKSVDDLNSQLDLHEVRQWQQELVQPILVDTLDLH